jgi:hypothetical protein
MALSVYYQKHAEFLSVKAGGMYSDHLFTKMYGYSLKNTTNGRHSLYLSQAAYHKMIPVFFCNFVSLVIRIEYLFS